MASRLPQFCPTDSPNSSHHPPKCDRLGVLRGIHSQLVPTSRPLPLATMPPLEMHLKAMNLAPYPGKATVGNFRNHNTRATLMLGPSNNALSPWSTGTYFAFAKPRPRPVPIPEPRRGVSFLPHVKVHYVLHIKDFTKDEVKDTYYSKFEVRAMKHQCKEDANNISASDYEKEEQYISMCEPEPSPLTDSTSDYAQHCFFESQNLESTVRGLENKAGLGSLRKKRHRTQAWLAVFVEQRRQKAQGYSDPDSIADSYFEVSEPCHVVANMVAIRDARDVQSMDLWETKAELEKENRQGIYLSEGSEKLEVFGQRYQRLVLQERDQRMIPRLAA